mgnify:CR=1 FL=1
MAGLEGKHYASSTSVTLLLFRQIIAVGHLGDSRICLIYLPEDRLAKKKRENGNSRVVAIQFLRLFYLETF